MSIQGQQTEKNGIKSGVARNVLRTPVQAPFSSSPPQGREPDTFRGKEPERVKAVFRNASHIKTAEAGFPKEMPLTLRSILRLNALRTVHLRKDVRSERKGCAGPSSEETFSRILPAARGRHDFSQRGTRRSREDGRDDALRAQRQTARKHARNTLRTVQRADAPKAFAPAEAGPSVPGGASGRTRRPESPLPFSTGSRKRSTDARGYATPAYGGGGMGAAWRQGPMSRAGRGRER